MRFSSIKEIIIKNKKGKAYDLVLDKIHLFYAKYLDSNRNILIHNSLPDIDTDFEAGTDEITLNFLYEKYGKERVVPVVTFGTFNEKGCLKDVARALGHDTGFESDVFAVTKEMPTKWDCTLEEWFIHYPNKPECSDHVRKWILDPNNKEIIDNTLKLQGQLRNLGKHAAGIVITPGPIWESMPVNICKGQIVSGFQESGNAKDLSSIGILKLDRLKLETLNVIKDCIKYIRERHGDEITDKVQLEVDFVNIHDKNLFDELRLGFNQGIFQFESEGMNAMLKSMRCENFDELVAANALYRPGPMGIKAHEEFIKNKFEPEKRTYAHNILAPLLEKTNGVLIYQEQLMFIANQIGGMSLGEGDNLRKAMDGAGKIISKKLEGKELSEDEENNKNYKSYKDLWTKFINGALAKGLSEEDVKKIESWLVKYLGYSFNLSHSLSYSYVAMQTLYLKHYYPTEFYCSLLNHPKTGNDDEKNKAWLNSALLSAMSKGIKIVPPNRKSNWDWTIIEDKIIAMGYSSINGMGEIAFKELKNNRVELMDKEMFFSTKWSKFNKTNFESCLKAGLFDDWANSREELIEMKQIKYKQSNQLDMFTNEVDTVLTVAERKFKNKDFEKTTDQIRYEQFLEICSLDLNLLNKIASVKEQFMKATGLNIDSALNFEDTNKFYYFMINHIEKKTAQWDGSNYYVLTISDGAATKKVTMNNDLYERMRLILETNCFYVTKFFKNKKGFLNFTNSAPFRKIIV